MGRDADLSPSLALVLSMHDGPNNLQYTGRIGHTSFDKRYFDRTASTPLTQGVAFICLSTSSCRHPHLCLMLWEYKITLPLSISSNKGTAHFTTLRPLRFRLRCPPSLTLASLAATDGIIRLSLRVIHVLPPQLHMITNSSSQ